MGKKSIITLILIFVFIVLAVGFILSIMNFDYELVEDYKNFKEMAKFSLESEYMKPYVREHLYAIIWNVLTSLAIIIVALSISIVLIIKVYQINSGEKSTQEINEIKINNRIFYEGKIRGLTDLLLLIETHKENVNMYGDKLIDFLEKLGYPNIVVSDENVTEYVKNFTGSAKELNAFLSGIDETKEYHLIQKDTGKIVPLNMKSLIPMLNFVLNDYDNQRGL